MIVGPLLSKLTPSANAFPLGLQMTQGLGGADPRAEKPGPPVERR
jgi:hypothetical protein